MTEKRSNRSRRGKRGRRSQDPFAAREAKRYVNPIPSREYILQCFQAAGHPMTLMEVAERLELSDDEGLDALTRRLQAMVRDLQLVNVEAQAFQLPDRQGLVEGVVMAVRDGYGFLVTDDAEQDDLFIPARHMRTVFHRDRVVARTTRSDRRGRQEVAIVEVVERHTQAVVGRFVREQRKGYVVPNNRRLQHRIMIDTKDQKQAKPGQIVEVVITHQPTMHNPPEGRIRTVLGDHLAPGMEVDIAKRTYQLPYQWSKTVRKQAASFGQRVAPQAKAGRKDLRDLPFVTIDGEDSRDFDDAVCCQALRRGAGWRLYVAIADVSAYVTPGSPIDEEAKLRGNSVYFPGEVIPMLPEVLSNNLCSLNPNVDRLCMVAEIRVSATGALDGARFYEAVMRSKARLTYTEVADWLQDDFVTPKRSKASRLLPHLQQLYGLYQALLQRRFERGAIEVETRDTKIVFSSQRKIEKIVPVARNEAHRLIEECMLAANVCAARFLSSKEFPTLYRIHAPPAVDRLTSYREFLGGLGLRLTGGQSPEPADYMRLLQSVKHRSDAGLIQTMTLRSLSQAVYSPDNSGHFGLAYDAYLHFTSPIRRYPDLLVHRAIKHVLLRGKPQTFAHSVDAIVALGEHCSMTERRADEATRDATDTLKCEYMVSHVGEAYSGTISNVTTFGCFVALQDIYIEGLLHVTALPGDYYQFEPKEQALVGRRFGNTFRLGDPIRVLVAKVNVEEKQIDFTLAS